MRVPDIGAAVLALALHEYVVVRHEALRVARPMSGAGSLLCFVGDFHRLEELDETARVRPAQALYELVVVRRQLLRAASPMPGHSATRFSTRYSVGDLNRIEKLDVKARVRLVASGVLCGRHRRVAEREAILSWWALMILAEPGSYTPTKVATFPADLLIC
jgi:hypothetical protein